MSAAQFALLIVGGLLAVGCVMLGWWFRGDTPCEDHPTARDQVDEPTRGDVPTEQDNGAWLTSLGDSEPGNDGPSLMRSGTNGLVMHRPGCDLLVRPEVVRDHLEVARMRKCAVCFEGDES